MFPLFVLKLERERHIVSFQMVNVAESVPSDEKSRGPCLPRAAGGTDTMASSAPNLLEKVNSVINEMHKSGLRDRLLERIGINPDGRFKENRKYM